MPNGRHSNSDQVVAATTRASRRSCLKNTALSAMPGRIRVREADSGRVGWEQAAPWKCDALNIAPGEPWNVIVNCNTSGTWAFRCHILPHAESDHGTIGIPTALIVQEIGRAGDLRRAPPVVTG